MEYVYINELLVAIIIKKSEDGINFYTPNDFSQQVATMKHPKGHIIEPHFHNKVIREVHYTQEVLIIRKGKLRVDFYDKQCKYHESRILNKDDIIILVSGGHGFEVLDDLEMIEVKQGPYIGEQDKTRFVAVEKGKVIIK